MIHVGTAALGRPVERSSTSLLVTWRLRLGLRTRDGRGRLSPHLRNPISMNAHPTAILDPDAKIHPSCKIGPYCTVGAGVEMGEDCELISHVAVAGPTKIGARNRFFPFSSIGLAPQDLSYRGEPTRLEIGDDNTVREFVTINRGTAKGGGLTRVGDHTLIMAYAHVAHDCAIGDNVILANAATLGGHVTVEEWAVVGALCPVHQYVRIGAHSYIGGGTTITRDVLPFSKTVAARDTHAYGLNATGLDRRGFSKERIRKIHHAYKVLLTSKLNTTQALEKLKSEQDRGEDVEMLIRFIEASERGVIK
jgi:UDP-N-acetylglucosamine acyltransferase